MVKEAARKCSHCGCSGHNSRTCSNGCIKLFGVSIEKNEQPLKRSASFDNIKSLDENNVSYHVNAGYSSDSCIGVKRGEPVYRRKKGKPWSEEEHRTFLTGLSKLRKGNWRGISKNFVITRTPSQVASHAQKYFLRQHASTEKKTRRPSLFDMTFKETDLASHQDDSKLPLIKTCGSSSQASNSSASSLKKLAGGDIPSQGFSPAQLVNRFPSLCLDSPHVMSPTVAAVDVSNYNPYMQGVLANGRQSFPASKFIPATSPFVSMMNYPCMLNSLASLAGCAPFIAHHPSGIPSPRSLAHNFSPPEGASTSSSAKKEDPLELKIGQAPKSSQGANLSSPASGAISVI